jgi:hypothetical protein
MADTAGELCLPTRADVLADVMAIDLADYGVEPMAGSGDQKV